MRSQAYGGSCFAVGGEGCAKVETMSSDELVVFVHGLGEVPEVWRAQAGALPDGFAPLVIDVFGPAPNKSFSLSRSAASIAAEIDRIGVAAIHLCGLSLGAMIALRFAVDYPDRVLSLTLAAGQIRLPKTLAIAQQVFMSLIPAKQYVRNGVDKPQMIAALKSARTTDFSRELAAVVAPTLVLCGSKDRLGLPGSRALAEAIANAELRVLAGAGHQSHLQAPEAFAQALGAFLRAPAGVLPKRTFPH